MGWMRAALILTLLVSTAALVSVEAQETASVSQQLFLYSQALGANSRIGILCQLASHQQELQGILISARAYKMEISVFDVKTTMELDKGFATLLNSKQINAILLLPDAVATSKVGLGILAQRCKTNKIALLAVEPGAMAAGAVMCAVKVESGLQLMVNKQKAQELGISFSAELQPKVKYVE